MNTQEQAAFDQMREALDYYFDVIDEAKFPEEYRCYVQGAYDDTQVKLRAALAAAKAVSKQPSQMWELSNDEITIIAKTACAEKRLVWLGFTKDEDGFYTVPDLSPSHFKLVREVIAAINAKGAA